MVVTRHPAQYDTSWYDSFHSYMNGMYDCVLCIPMFVGLWRRFRLIILPQLFFGTYTYDSSELHKISGLDFLKSPGPSLMKINRFYSRLFLFNIKVPFESHNQPSTYIRILFVYLSSKLPRYREISTVYALRVGGPNDCANFIKQMFSVNFQCNEGF